MFTDLKLQWQMWVLWFGHLRTCSWQSYFAAWAFHACLVVSDFLFRWVPHKYDGFNNFVEKKLFPTRQVVVTLRSKSQNVLLIGCHQRPGEASLTETALQKWAQVLADKKIPVTRVDVVPTHIPNGPQQFQEVTKKSDFEHYRFGMTGGIHGKSDLRRAGGAPIKGDFGIERFTEELLKARFVVYVYPTIWNDVPAPLRQMLDCVMAAKTTFSVAGMSFRNHPQSFRLLHDITSWFSLFIPGFYFSRRHGALGRLRDKEVFLYTTCGGPASAGRYFQRTHNSLDNAMSYVGADVRATRVLDQVETEKNRARLEYAIQVWLRSIERDAEEVQQSIALRG